MGGRVPSKFLSDQEEEEEEESSMAASPNMGSLDPPADTDPSLTDVAVYCGSLMAQKVCRLMKEKCSKFFEDEIGQLVGLVGGAGPYECLETPVALSDEVIDNFMLRAFGNNNNGGGGVDEVFSPSTTRRGRVSKRRPRAKRAKGKKGKKAGGKRQTDSKKKTAIIPPQVMPQGSSSPFENVSLDSLNPELAYGGNKSVPLPDMPLLGDEGTLAPPQVLDANPSLADYY